jgi:hypothetical protein
VYEVAVAKSKRVVLSLKRFSQWNTIRRFDLTGNFRTSTSEHEDVRQEATGNRKLSQYASMATLVAHVTKRVIQM